MTAMQGDKQPFWQQTWFVESNWISASTKWILTFGGKAARIVLIICTLYMSAELYPGVSLPPGLNLAVFIVLSFALDMGGLGLAQIAKTARDQGNTEGAEQGEQLARWLITIMIAGLVTVSLEHAVDMIDFFKPWKNDIAAFWILVEIALSIARVICAVNYGHVVHALERSVEDAQTQEQNHQEELQAEIAQLQHTLQEEKRQAQDSQAQLQADLQTARSDFALQMEAVKQSQNMTLQAAENQSSVVNDLQNQLREALQQAQLQTANLNQKQRELDLQSAQLQTATTDLQSAKMQVSDLQNQLQNVLSQVSSLTANLDATTAKMQDSAISLQSANQKIADLQNQLHEAKSQAATRPAKTSADNITSFDQARAKHEAAGGSKAKVSHAEIQAFKATHPDMKNADIAAQLGVSERTVYGALSAKRDQPPANADAAAQ